MALPKKHRLVIDKHMLSVLRKGGKRIQTPLFSALFLPGKGETGRCAVVVGTSIAKKAVVRNKLRRLIQEVIFEEIRAQRTNLNMIIYTKRTIVNARKDELKKQIQNLFAQIK